MLSHMDSNSPLFRLTILDLFNPKARDIPSTAAMIGTGGLHPSSRPLMIARTPWPQPKDQVTGVDMAKRKVLLRPRGLKITTQTRLRLFYLAEADLNRQIQLRKIVRRRKSSLVGRSRTKVKGRGLRIFAGRRMGKAGMLE